jgi:muramoyltetrapeptide carboxypeptidase
MSERSFVFPKKLEKGSMARVIAPSFSGNVVSDETKEYALRHFEEELGLRVSFSSHIGEEDDVRSSSVESRLEDLYDAFEDPEVDAVLPIIGGWNSNQLLSHINWDRIAANPKVFCGFSDITALANGITTKTGLVTYSGPNYSSFGQKHLDPYTTEYFKKALFSDEPFGVIASSQWTDDQWFINQDDRTSIPNPGHVIVQEGRAEGRTFGGTSSVLNLLQGTDFMPVQDKAILFLEEEGRSGYNEFDSQLQALLQSVSHRGHGIAGLLLGRFQQSSQLRTEDIKRIVQGKPELTDIPVVANADFGHTDPRFTFALGGTACLEAWGDTVSLTLLEH